MTEAEVTTEKEGTLCSCRILFNPNSICASVSIFLVYTIRTVGFFRLRFCFNGQCELSTGLYSSLFPAFGLCFAISFNPGPVFLEFS